MSRVGLLFPTHAQSNFLCMFLSALCQLGLPHIAYICHRRHHIDVASIHIMHIVTAACNLVGAVPCMQRATSKAEQMQIEKYNCIVKTPIQVTGRVRRPVFGTDSSHIVLSESCYVWHPPFFGSLSGMFLPSSLVTVLLYTIKINRVHSSY